MKLMESKRCIDLKWVNFCIFFQNDHVTGWWYSRSSNWFFLSNVWNIVALYKILYMTYNKWPWLTKTSNDGVWKGCGSSTERRKIGKIMFQFFVLVVTVVLSSVYLTHSSPYSHVLYVMLCRIWYHLYNLKSVKNTHGGVLLLVKFQASTCNFTENNAPPWVFFHVF